ncbi:MAG: hypothetical protein QOJ07_1749 [Thermoleophilaceae bacterium]|nr:hypothetical protein [Thermoleophilaceae bacterium]
MNLRTFLPPPPNEVAPLPAVGSSVPRLDGAVVSGPAVVAFLRHTGCPFAEWTARELRRAAAEHPDVEWVAVSHASAAATAAWAEAVGGLDGVRLVVDPERRDYAAWGLGRSSIGHFAGRRSLTQVARLARDGIRNRHPDGTRWQQAGTFAVGADGRLRERHLPAHAGELPDLAAAAAAAAGA